MTNAISYDIIIIERKEKRDKKTMKEKTFNYKGQMINYYNKVKANPKVKFCIMSTNATKGFTVSGLTNAANRSKFP